MATRQAFLNKIGSTHHHSQPTRHQVSLTYYPLALSSLRMQPSWCVLAPPLTAQASLHPTPALMCHRNQRQCAFHRLKLRLSRQCWCVLAAPSTACLSLHPTPALICRRNQRQFGCHQEKM